MDPQVVNKLRMEVKKMLNMLRSEMGRKLELNDNSQRNDAYEEELNENAGETLVSSRPRGFDRSRHNRFEATRHNEGCQTGGSAIRQCYPKVRTVRRYHVKTVDVY